MIVDKIRAVALAGIIILGLMTAGQFWLEHRVAEPFSEVSVLGPSMTIGGYPSTVSAGQNASFFVRVSNHEGHVAYYDVRTKVGDMTTVVNQTAWADLPTSLDERVILVDGENSTLPMQLAFLQPANDTKVIFEVWVFNSAVNGFQYSGLWGQILLNVTAP
ncbi:MAG TPA: DUF1616 domain-containing protein [Conexivisphaerales archaeon]|nr:DUF1616 domain-containing protein [Conexivisphaerales archaeon]